MSRNDRRVNQICLVNAVKSITIHNTTLCAVKISKEFRHQSVWYFIQVSCLSLLLVIKDLLFLKFTLSINEILSMKATWLVAKIIFLENIKGENCSQTTFSVDQKMKVVAALVLLSVACGQ